MKPLKTQKQIKDYMSERFAELDEQVKQTKSDEAKVRINELEKLLSRIIA